jgi:hypothetical protein
MVQRHASVSSDPSGSLFCLRLRDGAVIDDIDLSEGYPAEDVIRRVGQLG